MQAQSGNFISQIMKFEDSIDLDQETWSNKFKEKFQNLLRLHEPDPESLETMIFALPCLMHKQIKMLEYFLLQHTQLTGTQHIQTKAKVLDVTLRCYTQAWGLIPRTWAPTISKYRSSTWCCRWRRGCNVVCSRYRNCG